MVRVAWCERRGLAFGVIATCALAACDRDERRPSSGVVAADTQPVVASDTQQVVADAAVAVPEHERAKQPAPADPVKEADPKACLALCKIGQELECGTPFPLCVQQCQEMIDIPKCSGEMQRAITCFAGQPARAWECDPATKMPSLKEGPCGEEQRLVAECMQV